MELRAAVHQFAAQDDGSRIGKLTEIGARVGVVDDGVGGGAGGQAAARVPGAYGVQAAC